MQPLFIPAENMNASAVSMALALVACRHFPHSERGYCADIVSRPVTRLCLRYTICRVHTALPLPPREGALS